MVPLSEVKERRKMGYVSDVQSGAPAVGAAQNAQMAPMEQKVPPNYQCKGIDGSYKQAVFPLDIELVFGRDYHVANIIFESEKISRQHCRLSVAGGRICLTDLGSSNGTFLADGTRCKPNTPYTLRKGECFYLVDKSEMFKIL